MNYISVLNSNKNIELIGNKIYITSLLRHTCSNEIVDSSMLTPLTAVQLHLYVVILSTGVFKPV